MKLLLMIIYLSMPYQISAADKFLSQIRSLYELAVQNEKSCKELLANLENYNEDNNPLYAGYKAAGTMLMAKFVFSPFSKLNNFKKGRILLEKAIAKEQNNTELRFIRYSIQLNAPSFLNYNSQIKTDKNFIIQQTGNLKDVELKKTFWNSLKMTIL